jgi:hypothetical protein
MALMTDLLAAEQAYADLGWATLPVVHGGKEFHMPHRIIAEHVGLRWQSVSRLARQLVGRGLAKMKPGKSGNGTPTGEATEWEWIGPKGD